MSAVEIRRRLFLGSAVGALALTPSRMAQADTSFSNFRFPATGAPTARTLPDRLDDVINVKDWGATGNGRTDDTAAIQAAINHTATRNYAGGSGATLFFPTGRYNVSQPLLISSPGSPRLIGSGKESTIIAGNFEGFIISAPGTPPNLSVTNAVDNGTSAHLIRLTLAINATMGGDILPNIQYTVSGIAGTVGAAANGTWKFTNVVYTLTTTTVDLIGSHFPAGASYTGGGTITGPGTQAGTIHIEGLQISNAAQLANSGAVKIGFDSVAGSINNCHFEGFVGVDIASNAGGGGVFGFGIYDCYLQNGAGVRGLADRSNTGGAYAGMRPGSVGCYMGQGVIANCRIQSFYIGIAMDGVGTTCIGCSVERSDLGIYVGLRDDREMKMIGHAILGFQTEATQHGIYIQNSNGGLIAGNVLTASRGTPDYARGTFSWSSGTVTVTADNPHHLGSSGIVGINLDGSSGAFNPNGPGGNLTATITGPSTFTYPLATNPGASVHANWNLAPVASIAVGGLCMNTTFSSNSVEHFYSPITSVDLSAPAAHYNNVFETCTAASGIKYPIPSNKASWKFRQVGTVYVNPEAQINMNFADLPNGGLGVQGTNNQPGPFEGQEYMIVDCPTNPIGNFMTSVSNGGGTFHAKLRYCGSPLSWRIVG
jgi:Pectate lyase superfamily protein